MFPTYGDWNIAYTSPYARLMHNVRRMWNLGPLAIIVVSFCWTMVSGISMMNFAKSNLRLVLVVLKYGIEWAQNIVT